MSARSARLCAALAGCWFSLGTACHERFEFDVPAGSGGRGGSAGAGLASGAGGSEGGTAGAAASGGNTNSTGGTASQAGAPDLPDRCGEHESCPSGLHCGDGECQECATDADCVGAGSKRCDLTRYRCIECITTSDCAEGFRCDPLGNRCLMACAERSDCLATAHGCNATRGVCYECDDDRECARSALGPLCALDGSGCVQCRDDDECDELLCDPLTGRCVECRDGLDCASRLCDPLEHVCLLEP